MRARRFLVCVDGSRAALSAARLAVSMAADQGGIVRAVAVIENGDTLQRLDAKGRQERPAADRLEHSARSMLQRVATIGEGLDVRVETGLLRGDPLRAILRDARAWDPDLVVIGRTGRSGPGSPLLGSLAMLLVEFTEWPVVVVPDAAPV